MYCESKMEPVQPYKFPWRKAIWVSMALVMSTLVGMWGYSYFLGNSLLDSFFNTSMILSGMGSSEPVITTASKIFVSLFALYSAFFLLATVSVFISDFAKQVLGRVKSRALPS